MALSSQLVLAKEPDVDGAKSAESRDAASAFIGSMQFTVGRIGRDCLGLVDWAQKP